MSALPSTPLERVRHHLVGLKMVRALETLDSCVRQLEEGTISALEMLDELLGEEHSTRETRRIKAQLMTARLTRIKTLEGEMYADVGDWIIRGVAGEFYPCKPDIFDATYEAN